MSNLVRSSIAGVSLARRDRQTGRAVAELHAELFVERARDAARRDLAVGRIQDIGLLTEHALAEGAAIAATLKAEMDAAPFAATALAGIAEEGINGIRREQRRFALEG